MMSLKQVYDQSFHVQTVDEVVEVEEAEEVHIHIVEMDSTSQVEVNNVTQVMLRLVSSRLVYPQEKYVLLIVSSETNLLE